MYLFKKNKKSPENKYTEFYEKKEIDGKERIEEKLKNKDGFKRLLKVFGLIFIISILIYTYNSTKNKEIIENGIQKKAVIKDIQHNFYRVNDYESRTVSNYNIVYEYIVENRKINSTYNIDIKLYNKLDIKINDSILILYNSKDIKQNEILFKFDSKKR